MDIGLVLKMELYKAWSYQGRQLHNEREAHAELPPSKSPLQLCGKIARMIMDNVRVVYFRRMTVGL